MPRPTKRSLAMKKLWAKRKKSKRLPLLNTRQTTHGDFTANAELSQEIKELLRDRVSWFEVKPIHQEALDMICVKMSRIMSGKSGFKGHWEDIVGYAKLGEEACE